MMIFGRFQITGETGVPEVQNRQQKFLLQLAIFRVNSTNPRFSSAAVGSARYDDNVHNLVS